MTAKTITLTEEAYTALSLMKAPNESFTKTILRINAKKSLKSFLGILSESQSAELEHSIKELRKKHTKEHAAKIQRIKTHLDAT